MSKDQQIANMAYEINESIKEYARIAYLRTMNTMLTDTGEIYTILEPGELERKYKDALKDLNEKLDALSDLWDEDINSANK